MGENQQRHRPDFSHLRRVLVILGFTLWQGGFLFYSSVVVPIGTDVLGSTAEQGAITRRVTNGLNVMGAVALGLLAWDQACTRDVRYRRTAARWWLWAVAFVCQYLMFFLHEVLDYFLSPDGRSVVPGTPFRLVHRAYLWASTIQWAAAMILLWCMTKAWTAEDQEAA